MSDSSVALDVVAMIELARRHPAEYEKLKESLEDSASPGVPGDQDMWLPSDRFQRTLAVGSLVLTPAGERGRIIRFDRNSQRALIELDKGGTRLLKLNRIELRRGRPRKGSYASAQMGELASVS